LLCVHRSKPAFEGFYLEDYAPLHKQIDPKAILELDAVVREVNAYLTLDPKSTLLELLLQQVARTPTRATPDPAGDESGSPPPAPRQ